MEGQAQLARQKVEEAPVVSCYVPSPACLGVVPRFVNAHLSQAPLRGLVFHLNMQDECKERAEIGPPAGTNITRQPEIALILRNCSYPAKKRSTWECTCSGMLSHASSAGTFVHLSPHPPNVRVRGVRSAARNPLRLFSVAARVITVIREIAEYATPTGAALGSNARHRVWFSVSVARVPNSPERLPRERPRVLPELPASNGMAVPAPPVTKNPTQTRRRKPVPTRPSTHPSVYV